MGRRERAKRERKRNLGSPKVVAWREGDGVHALVPADASHATLEEMTRRYQENIRRSPLWDLMVKEYGGEETTRLLEQFRAWSGSERQGRCAGRRPLGPRPSSLRAV